MLSRAKSANVRFSQVVRGA